MSLVIKTQSTEVYSGYSGGYPYGSVTYTGTMNGHPVSRSVSTEINPPSGRPTDSESEFNRLVEESGAVPHLCVKGNGEYTINFTGDGYPVELANQSPSEVTGWFRDYYVVKIPIEAIEERDALLAKAAKHKTAVADWLRINPDREEWEYGIEDEDYSDLE